MTFNLIISYNLLTPGRDYSRLEAGIKNLGQAIKVNYTVWCAETAYNAVQARDYLMQFLDTNDRLFVAESNGTAAWKNIAENISAFICKIWNK